MTNEPRTASDVLLSLESKIDQLIALYRSQDLVLKVLANKLNNLIDTVNHLPSQKEVNNTKPEPNILNISSDFQLPVEVAPKGFRRTSRPETYVVEEKPTTRANLKSTPTSPVVAPPSNPSPVTLPVQFPDFSSGNVPPGLKTSAPKKSENVITPPPVAEIKSTGNKIPTEQRVVDKNGKAIYMASVMILSESGNLEYKTTTSSMGKWQASLLPGRYQVKISKLESMSREKLDVAQNITVDGLSVTQTLPVLICK